MRERTATTLLLTENIFYIFVLPALNLYLVFCGIVANVVLFLLLIWG
jgi:hypothetical protein